MAHDAPSAVETPSGPSLLRSGGLSLATSAAPLVVALLALPLLTRHLGTERLGLLALAWAWLGYAALLDFGLGRALTRLVATSDVGAFAEAPVGAIVNTAHVTLTLVGAVVGGLGAAVAPWYMTSVLHVSAALQRDAIVSAILFALTVPAVTGASVPRAVLEARQRFRDVNLVRLPVSVGTFAVPVLLLPVTPSLTVIAATLASVRLWAWWRYTTLARIAMPSQRSDTPALRHLQPLLRAGAWITVTNVLSPLMTVADRFLIGSLVSVTAVALYSVPWEAVNKLLIVPGALTMVVFPALARAATVAPRQLITLHTSSARLIALIVVPVCAIACLLAPWLLQMAGGAQYTGASVAVLQILAVGVAANCIAAIPFSVLQASGNARTAAMIHLLEVVPFLLLVWVAIEQWGIIGAAVACAVRAVADAAMMSWRAQKVAPLDSRALSLSIGGVCTVAVAAMLGAYLPASIRVGLAVALALAAAAPMLYLVRQPARRAALASQLTEGG